MGRSKKQIQKEKLRDMPIQEMLELVDMIDDHILVEHAKNVLAKGTDKDREGLIEAVMLWSEEKSIPIEKDAQQSAEDLRKAAIKAGALKPQQMYAPFANVPTEICRVSPFFIMSREEMASRPYVKGMLIGAPNQWGQLSYSGPKLSTYEEDVFFAVLALIDLAEYRFIDEVNDHKTYAFGGPLFPILKLMGKGGCKKEYSQVLTALEYMAGATFKMTLNTRGPDGRIIEESWDITNMLSHVKWRNRPGSDRKEVYIVINPYFYERYLSERVTLIDVIERAKLNSQTAKAVMRFLSSHRHDRWDGMLLTLVRSINLNENQPVFKLRQTLKAAIRELVSVGYLQPESGFDKQHKDHIVLIRVPRKVKQRKKIIAKNPRLIK